MSAENIWDRSTLGILSLALEDGRLSGVNPEEEMSDCPFDLTDRTRRDAWIAGFAIGRAQALRLTAVRHWWRDRP